MMFKWRFFAILALAFLTGFAESNQSGTEGKKSSAISIIGNSELPDVEVVLPWRVAEGSRRSDSDLQKIKMPDAGKPIGLETHRRQVFFDQHLKMLPEGFSEP